MLIAKALCGLTLLVLTGWVLGWVLSDYRSGVVVVVDAGHLQINGERISLYGVRSLPRSEHCRFAGKSWPCGAQGAQALTSWLSDATVRCWMQGRAPAGDVLALCYRGLQDIGQWVVLRGWGLVDERGRYLGAAAAAKEKLAGIWGSEFRLPVEARTAAAQWRMPAEGVSDRAVIGGSWRALMVALGLLAAAVGALYRRRRRGSSPTHHRSRIARAARVLQRLKIIGEQRGAGAQFAYLRKVDPWVVGELVLTALEGQGHRISRSPRYTGDGGVDGRCWIDGAAYLLQVKRYGGHISARHVSEFGTLCESQDAQGLFVHTGRTGLLARAVCPKRVRIVSGRGLLELLNVRAGLASREDSADGEVNQGQEGLGEAWSESSDPAQK
jgi:restriction system protein